MAKYFKVTQKRSVWFLLALVCTLAMQILILISSILVLPYFFIEGEITDTFLWYRYATLGLILVGIIGTILTYFFRKIGVYLIVASYFLIIMFQPEFSLEGSLSVIFALFFFVVFGLLSIVPRWEMFK